MLDRLANVEFSARAFIAALFSVTTCIMFLRETPIPAELMLINGVVVVDYFRTKQAEKASGVDVPLAKPYIPGEQ